MRIRQIKPDFWSDDDVSELSHSARLLWIALWSIADDEGRGDCTTAKGVRMKAFPGDDDVTNDMVARWMDQIEAQGFIHRYRVDRKVYYRVPSWKRHQRVNRPRPSDIPAPPSSPSDPSWLNPISESHRRVTDPSVNSHGSVSECSCEFTEPVKASDSGEVDTINDLSLNYHDPSVIDHSPRAGAQPHAHPHTQTHTHTSSDPDLTDFEIVERGFQWFRGKHGKPWRRGFKDYSHIEQAAETLRSYADESGCTLRDVIAESLSGLATDDRARKAGFPLGFWTNDPLRYLGGGAEAEAEDTRTDLEREYQELQSELEYCTDIDREEQIRRRMDEIAEAQRGAA